MSERYILIHSNGEIINTDEGITFNSQNPQFMAVYPPITFIELQNIILQKLGQQNNKQVTQVLYRLPMVMGKGVLRYKSWQLSSDNDVELMFTFHSQFPDIHFIELFVIIEESHFSSGGSAPDPAHMLMSQPVRSPTHGMESPVQNENIQEENADDLMGGPSFHQLAMQIAQPLSRVGPISGGDFSVDYGDDEEEPVEIPFDSDSGSDGVAAEPITESQPYRTQSQFQSQSSEHVGHYSSLNLEAMHARTFPGFSIGGGGEFPSLTGENELQVGQQFRDKEAVLFAIKNYSIRRSVEYKVLESDHIKYHGKCKYFGNGCNWSIRVSYRQKKELWEIRKYNGPHTCVSTSLSQDHLQLDTNVICATIFPMVQADSTISIKVLQGAVENRFGFKASYRKVWLAKQKAIARIFGDWEESYNELPRWLQGLQAFIPGTFSKISTVVYYMRNSFDLLTLRCFIGRFGRHNHRIFNSTILCGKFG